MKKLILFLITAGAAATLLQAEPITVLTSGNRLLTIDSASPGTVTGTVTVTGLDAGEVLAGIDFRPATGELFALGVSSRIYSISAGTGVATPVGSAGAFTLDGTSFGFDFNPTSDRIRVTSDTGQNIRLNPIDGTLAATDTALTYNPTDVNAGATPNVVGSAYTNSFAAALTTVLYDIDSGLDILVRQSPPNDGTLNTVGTLGVDTTDAVGFDISGVTGAAYAALNVAGTSNLYTIDLGSGLATATAASSAIAPADLGSETVVDTAANVNPGSRLDNISTRGNVGTDEALLIGGFITTGGVNSRLVLRAIGPSLSGSGVNAPLADPVLTLYDDNGAVLLTNDDWQSDPAQAAEITATGLAPDSDLEAAIITRLAPAAYTAIVSGKPGDTGIALVEIYQVQ